MKKSSAKKITNKMIDPKSGQRPAAQAKRHVKIRRDKAGYEYGGPDLTKMRRIEGEERDAILKQIKRDTA